MTIPFWVIPAIITVAAVVWLNRRPTQPAAYIDLSPLFEVPIALCVILLAWLVYFIIV